MTPGPVNPLKSKVKGIIDSSSEIKIGWAKVALLICVAAAALSVGRHAWYREAGDPIFGISTARGQASSEQVAVSTEYPTATPFEEIVVTQTPYVIRETITEIVTATPTPVPPTPVVEYIPYEVTVEVQTIVTNTIVATPVAPLPLANQTVEICVRVEGAREIYVGNVGVVSGQCSTFGFGIGQTSILVQVNK